MFVFARRSLCRRAHAAALRDYVVCRASTVDAQKMPRAGRHLLHASSTLVQTYELLLCCCLLPARVAFVPRVHAPCAIGEKKMASGGVDERLREKSDKRRVARQE